MKQSKLFHLLFPFIVMAIPWIYLAFVWKDLPAIVPIHFGISGNPDCFAERSTIILAPVIFTVLGVGIYFLLRNIYKLDPKQKYTPTTSGVMSKIAVIIVILLCAVCLFIIYWTLHGKAEGLNILFCGISLFVAYIGNLMHSIKPNYFAGFRLPWTLENEDNWRRTHQLASKVWFIGGITMAIVSLLVNNTGLLIVFGIGILVMVLIPGIYSYNMYRRSL